MAPTVVIAAGGTGGHIFPGLALADAIRRREPDARIAFVGTSRGLERTLIPARGYPLHLVDMRPLARKVGLAPVLAVLSLVRASFQARRILRREGAAVAVGMGGYASLPLIAGARLAGVSALVHESGAVPGLANRVAARLTPNVALSFQATAAGFSPRLHPRVTGMPLPPALANVDRGALRAEARRELELPEDVGVVLVLGGSLGARRLNEVGIGLAGRWRERGDVRILLKAGREHLDGVRAELDRMDAGRAVRAMAFLDRMDLAYAAADLAICRAGAGTVAELPAAGLPAILVPYPHAPGDHQTKNAAALVRAGAAVLVPDAQATAERIGPVAESLLADPERLERMGAAARTLARPRAAEDLADWTLELAGGGRG